MSEVEKMYENANIEPKYIEGENLMEYSYGTLKYPSFTAEKQLKLIEYFSNNYNISINKDNNIFRLLFINKDGVHNFYTSGVDFAEQLALFVISRYKNQILTPEEKQQVKEILEWAI